MFARCVTVQVNDQQTVPLNTSRTRMNFTDFNSNTQVIHSKETTHLIKENQEPARVIQTSIFKLITEAPRWPSGDAERRMGSLRRRGENESNKTHSELLC